MTTALIGLTGRAFSGKDTAFEQISQSASEAGLVAKRGAFADKLKLSAARLFFPDIGLEDAIAWCNQMKHNGAVTAYWSDVDPHGEPKDSYGMSETTRAEISGRSLLQHHGTEAHRQVFDDNFWVDQLLPKGKWEFTEAFAGSDFAVVTDVRFANEAERIIQEGGEIWQIVRPEAQTIEDHASEVPLDSHYITTRFLNDRSIADFQSAIAAQFKARFLP